MAVWGGHALWGGQKKAGIPTLPTIHTHFCFMDFPFMNEKTKACQPFIHILYGLLFYESNPYQPSIHKSISTCFMRSEKKTFCGECFKFGTPLFFLIFPKCLQCIKGRPNRDQIQREEKEKKGKWGFCCISSHCQQSIMGGGREVGIWLQITMGRKQIMAINLHQHKKTMGRK